MISEDKDPLRFLKPRKKQFHLTPTKQSIKKQSQKLTLSTANPGIEYSFLNNQLTKSTSISKNINKNNENIREIENKHKTEQNNKNSFINNQFNNNHTKKSYNPLKYFSKEVQQYLRNKNGINKKQFEQNNTVKAKQKKQQIILNSKGLSEQYIIPLKKNQQFINSEPGQNTVRLEDYFGQNSSNISKITDKNNKDKRTNNEEAQFFEQIKKNVSQVNKKVSNLSPINFKHDQYDDNDSEKFQQNQLKACDICGRRFNPNSYQKHVKICEKVFFKKRKQFSSEKQRSQSKDKKKK